MSNEVNTKLSRRLHITREEEADRCLNHTVYSKGAQAMLVVMFLLIVFGIPITQHVVEIHRNLAKREAWNPKSGQPEPRILPQVYDVFALLPTTDQFKQAKGFWGYWSLIPSGESISSFETSLKENSILTEEFLSPTQSVMSGILGVGNEKAYLGQDHWLFYRPDVEYLTSDGFLDPDRLKLRSHGSSPVQPNPVKALVDLNEQLRSRNIQLVVVPMPTKPMVESEMLAGSAAAGPGLQNPSFPLYVRELQENGIRVFDPTPILLRQQQKTRTKQFLVTDTHWTPTGMAAVARELASFLEAGIAFPSVPRPGYLSRSESVSNLGDIAEMLKLPKDQTLYAKQQVTVDRITQRDGSDWQADHQGDILLLGDSFTNIYSLEGMEWGTSAGFAEHLSYALDRPIDKIAINAGGSFASRRALAQQLASGVDRLAGKKGVVYEFSMRDLTEGDWKLIHMAHPTPVESSPPVISNRVVVKPTQPTKVFPINPGTVKPAIIKPQSNPPGANPLIKSGPGMKPVSPKTPNPGQATPSTQPPKGIPTKPVVKHNEVEGLLVTGRIAARATTPKPGSVPYKDCLIALQITDIKATGGSIKGSNIVVYVWGMKDNALVDSLFTVGQTLKFKLTPWASVESKYGGLNRQELESDDTLSWSAYWGEISR